MRNCHFKKILLLFFFVALFFGCSNEKKIGDGDLVLFTKANSDVSYQMRFDGKNVQEFDGVNRPPKKWEEQRKILNNICSGTISPTNPISVISPDGAVLGDLEDFWQPMWSPDENLIAVACGADRDGNVLVVSNTEQTGSSEGWSRDGSGWMSDRIEIFIVNEDGSSLMQLTANESGDWLPRWFPSDQLSANASEFYDLLPLGQSDEGALYAAPLLVETNRNGNSEIYVLSTISTKSWRITNNDSRDQSPSWSSNGTAIGFSSDRNGDFEIFYTLSPSSGSSKSSGEMGRPYVD